MPRKDSHNNIRKARKAVDLTMKELGEKVGVASPCISIINFQCPGSVVPGSAPAKRATI